MNICQVVHRLLYRITTIQKYHHMCFSSVSLLSYVCCRPLFRGCVVPLHLWAVVLSPGSLLWIPRLISRNPPPSALRCSQPSPWRLPKPSTCSPKSRLNAFTHNPFQQDNPQEASQASPLLFLGSSMSMGLYLCPPLFLLIRL